MGKLLYFIMLAPTTGWKLTNHHKNCLSVQCDILCNCSFICSYKIAVPNDSRCIFSALVWLWNALALTFGLYEVGGL